MKREYPTPRQWRNRVILVLMACYLAWTIGQLVTSPVTPP